MKYLITILIISCFSLSSFADEKGGHRMERMTKKLELSEEQAAQVKSIFDSKKDQRDAIHQQMEALHQQTNSEIANILTPEQLEKFNTFKDKKKDRKNKHHSKGAPSA